MHVVIHVTGYYDWEPVPADVKVTEADIKSLRVKPSQGGGWLMRVEKKADTHTTVIVPEEEIVSMIIQEMTRGDKTALTRLQAAHRFITRYHLDHNTHKKWMQEVEVSDDGAKPELLEAALAAHVEAGNISEHDVEELTAAYLEPSTSDLHVEHLHDAWGVTPEKIAKRQAKLAAKATEGAGQ